MVPSLAKRAVEKKIVCKTNNSLLSDYEFAYAINIAYEKAGMTLEVKALKELQQEFLDANKPEIKEGYDDPDNNLMRMIATYVVKSEEPDEQMIELLKMK